MNLDLFHRTVSLDDSSLLTALSDAVREWEPSLELYRPPRDALLYEPDGTLYAVCLAETIRFRTDRRTVLVRAGDAIVVPQALAIDAGPDVDLLAIRHDGTPPDHFRERFIQVWGFDHMTAPEFNPGRSLPTDIIPWTDARLRLTYAVCDVSRANSGFISSAGDVRLVFGLSGALTLTLGTHQATLNPRQIVAVLPGTSGSLVGEGRAGVLTVLNELAHEARRSEQTSGEGGSWGSPEYRPRNST